jgi:hypothetical protein
MFEEQVPLVIVTVHPGQPVGLGLGQELHALVADEVILHPEGLPGGVDPAISVTATF